MIKMSNRREPGLSPILVPCIMKANRPKARGSRHTFPLRVCWTSLVAIQKAR